jgi:hypothetical protein
MAKRQQRISSLHIEGSFPGLRGQLATLVLRSGRATMVTPHSFADNSLVVKDMMGKNHAYPVSAIEELIVEKPA